MGQSRQGRSQYFILSEKGYCAETGGYQTFGIKVCNPYGETVLHDVTACEAQIASIVALLNKHQPSVNHLGELIKDFII